MFYLHWAATWAPPFFAAVAAGFWAWSAVVQLPDALPARYDYNPEGDELLAGLKTQSNRSAWGAAAAAVSAGSQAFAMAFGLGLDEIVLS